MRCATVLTGASARAAPRRAAVRSASIKGAAAPAVDEKKEDKEEIKTLKEDLKRADQRVLELTTAKNLAEAGANAKVNTVTSLKRNLSKKTGLYDKEKEKAEILISNATRVQDQYRSHGPNHLAAFKSDVQKYVDKIFEAATVYYRAVDDQLDELTQANSSLHSTKRPAEEPLYSKDPHPSSR